MDRQRTDRVRIATKSAAVPKRIRLSQPDPTLHSQQTHTLRIRDYYVPTTPITQQATIGRNRRVLLAVCARVPYTSLPHPRSHVGKYYIMYVIQVNMNLFIIKLNVLL